MEKTAKYVYYNQLTAEGHRLSRYDDMKKGDTPCIFLRHTAIEPGEECFLEDLSEGDVFFTPGDVITEWVLVRRGHDFYKIRRVADKNEEHFDMAGRLATVVLVRRKQQEVKA